MQIGSTLRQTGSVAGILATIALALAIISFPYAVRSQLFASLPEPNAVVAAVPAPAERLVPLDPEADFAFGFLVYDWDPRAPAGIPGFDRWIPAAQPNTPLIQAQIP